MTTEKAQMIVGLGGLALVVLGPLSMIVPVFFFSPVDASSWCASLGIGFVVALLPLAGALVLSRRGWLDPAQAIFGGALLLIGTTTLTATLLLLANGLFDTAPPTPLDARVEASWFDCTKHRAQTSTVTTNTCYDYGGFTFAERPPIDKVRLPDDADLEVGETVAVSLRRGALGWAWGFRLENPTAP
ncbi:MAG: hypothetical protein AAGD38_15840 [Acidobacteriota bacterium]